MLGRKDRKFPKVCLPSFKGNVMSFPIRLVLGAAAALLVPIAVLAQNAGPSTNPGSVQPGSYTLETRHARIVWSVSHMGLSQWWGDFAGATGTATLDPKDAKADMVDISIPVASLTTTNTVLDGELKSPMWFDAVQFPIITFKSSSVVPTGPGTADVNGNLTFHGVTKPVTLKVKFRAAGINSNTKKYTVGFDAVAEIKRSDFNVNTLLALVGDDVKVEISAPFERAG
jgi:polyisoprenoid-binding protein YceI